MSLTKSRKGFQWKAEGKYFQNKRDALRQGLALEGPDNFVECVRGWNDADARIILDEIAHTRYNASVASYADQLMKDKCDFYMNNPRPSPSSTGKKKTGADLDTECDSLGGNIIVPPYNEDASPESNPNGNG